MTDEPVSIEGLKTKLVKALSHALDVIAPEDKGFSAVCTAALAAVKAFHGEIPAPEASDAQAITDKLMRYKRMGVSGAA